MINKETAKVQYTTVADQSTWYAVDFEYFTTPATGLPQLKVLLDGQELTANKDYITGPQGIQLVVAPTAGVSLVIERDIPFTQEIDFQMGLIDPEKIERGLDESVMRDQELATGISDLDAKHDSLAEEVEEVRTVAEGAAADAASAVQTATDAANAADSASKKVDEAKTAADNADTKAQDALDLANSYDARITTAQDTADSAKTTADSAKTTADQALTGLDGKQDKGDYATKTELSQGLAGKADTSVTDTLRTDVDGLDNQVSGIEEKIPADASSSNQLATKADLSNIDALPSQAGNEGKFLTTDGVSASWAEIKQGSEIEWFKEFSISKNEYNALPEPKTGYVGLRFKLPVGIPDGIYEFYTRGTTDPMDDVFWTESVLYHKFYIKNGSAVRGFSYYANQHELTFTNGTSAIGGLGFDSSSGLIVSFCGNNGWDTADALAPIYFSTLADDEQYDTVKVTKLKNIKTGVEYEPTNVEQIFSPVEYTDFTMLQPIVSVFVPDYSSSSWPTTVDLTDDSHLGFYSVPNPWYNSNFDYGKLYPWPVVLNIMTPNGEDFASFKFLFYKGEIKAYLLHGTGAFANASDFVVSRASYNSDSEPQVHIVIKKIGGFGVSVLCQAYYPNTGSEPINVQFVSQEGFDESHSAQVVPYESGGSGAVSSVNGKTGAVVLSAEDVGAVEKNQGSENAGKFLKVGADGVVVASAESGGGGLAAVAHDATLEGDGTDGNPLKLSSSISRAQHFSDLYVGQLNTEDNVMSYGPTGTTFGHMLTFTATAETNPVVGFLMRGRDEDNAVYRMAGQVLTTFENVDAETAKKYNTLDVCAMNNLGKAAGFVARIDYDDTEGTVELFAAKDLPASDNSNLVPTTKWVQKVASGKQDTLSAEQLAAANSGITAEHVASYDAYAAEISAAQSTADKADNAAEVAQQTANLAGQEAAQALSALAGKVNIAQGADNAGKVMTVGADGNLAPADAPSTTVTTDATLTGTGTASSPLGIAQSVKDSINGKVSKSGDTMTGVLNFDVPAQAETIRFTPQSWLETTGAAQQIIWRFGKNDGWAIGYNRIRSEKDNFGVIGDSDYRLKNVYTYLLNNGADIAIPTTGGTMALTSDIPDVSEFQTASQVTAIADTQANAAINSRFLVVDALPAEPDANTFYFIKKA